MSTPNITTDLIKCKGHFKIQSIGANNEVLDEFDDGNMIMESARTTMSEIFANLSSADNGTPFINKIYLGTFGHVDDSIITPKATAEGFVKERTRLFSSAAPYAVQDMIPVLRKNDCIKNTVNNTYYIYKGEVTNNYVLSASALTDTATWTNIGLTAPYTYSVGFKLPKVNGAGDGVVAQNLVEDTVGAGSTVHVKQDGTSVTFTISIANAAANLQNGNTSIFTEAALYANDRIFAMKTFKAKVKDNAVLLRIVWTITF